MWFVPSAKLTVTVAVPALTPSMVIILSDKLVVATPVGFELASNVPLPVYVAVTVIECPFNNDTVALVTDKFGDAFAILYVAVPLFPAWFPLPVAVTVTVPAFTLSE